MLKNNEFKHIGFYILLFVFSVAIISAFSFMSVYATDDDALELQDESNQQIIDELQSKNNIINENFKAWKLSNTQKTEMLGENENVDIDDSEVYLILKGNIRDGFEEFVVADVAVSDVAASEIMTRGSGVVTHIKDGRVKIESYLKYGTMVYQNLTYYKGIRFGGKVISQQNGVHVTSIKTTYHDVGGYVTDSGRTGMSGDYKKTKSISVADRKKLKTFAANRNKYFNIAFSVGSVDNKYTVTYTVNGGTKKHKISVNASVKGEY